MKKLASIVAVAFVLVSSLAFAADADIEKAEPCFIECNGGCRIAQGPTYANSKYIYEEMSFGEYLALGFGKKPPVRTPVFEKLKELIKDKTCGAAKTLGKCAAEEFHSKYHFGIRVTIDGENGRHVQDVSKDEIDSVMANLIDLGQCTKSDSSENAAPTEE